jgi:phosphoglycerol transferase MdoB-like AlkP superfamily enzyme
MLDTSLVPAEGTWSILDVHDKSYPYSYGYSFKNNGYSTYAFHNYDYDYYERDKYFETMGFDKYLGNGNGLEKYMNFAKKPSSDYDMFKSTFDLYSDDDKFLAYFITMSGHRDYNMKHAIVKKNWDLVKDLDYSDATKAYLATQIELDKAMEVLLKKLEKKGILKDTVIVLAGDHYPYGLKKEEILEIDSTKKDNYSIERDHSTLIIYNSEIDQEVEKYCYSMDVLPTILNLFGIEYDSRLLMGRDILSNSSQFVLFSNRSFISDKGIYNSNNNQFMPFNNLVDEDYLSKMKNDIYLKYRISRLILENDYYKYVKNYQIR